jgi:DNA invertase Pin-like site-specific DNA recombinase
VKTLHEIESTLRYALRIVGVWKKRLNAYASHEKMKERGTRPGRKRTRDDKAIARLRKQGLSIRAIAEKAGCSTTTVQRSLKEEVEE